MPDFRAKTMRYTDWPYLQRAFTELFSAAGEDKRLALFLRNDPDLESSTLLIPSYQSSLVEKLSPGGWHDMPDAQEKDWTLVAGSPSAFEEYGLRRGKDA